MKLKEYEGVQLFSECNIPTPASVLIKKGDRVLQKVDSLPQQLVVKAQVVTGKRKKAGGVQFATKKTVSKICKELLGKKINGYSVKEILIVEKLAVKKEFYLALTIDRIEKQYILIFSEQGGIDIEELAAKHPEHIKRMTFYDIHECDFHHFFPKYCREELITLSKQLYKLMKLKDAILAEINPLIFTKDNKLVAADAKVVVDENAFFRHPEFSYQGRYFTALEMRAKKQGVHYVELDGNIAVIGNGAGLVMTTLDMIHHFGGKPANFCDIGGGTGAEVMQTALALALHKKGIKALLINIFAGITHCDEIAEGIRQYVKKHKVKIPLVIRMIGTHEVKAKSILKSYKLFHSLEESVQHVVEVVV